MSGETTSDATFFSEVLLWVDIYVSIHSERLVSDLEDGDNDDPFHDPRGLLFVSWKARSSHGLGDPEKKVLRIGLLKNV